ncbi:MAG: hypothetical protein Q9220_001129 [cf. Caloplaca sp. 1 TL-2023]
MAQYTREQLQYFVNHVVLPPKLPQTADEQRLVVEAERALLDLVVSTASRFEHQSTQEYRNSWLIVHKMLSNWADSTPRDGISQKTLTERFVAMEVGDSLPIHVRAQNASIIIRRKDGSYTFESFEVSMRSRDVIGCKGSQRRSFPAHAVSIPLQVAADPKFQKELFAMMRKLDLEVVDEMMPQSQKASKKWPEIRDTCNPGLVTELVMGTLAAMGTPYDASRIQKRIRDDVLWKDAYAPWRRSPKWLVLRISLQTSLAQRLDPMDARAQYKNFMIALLSNLLELCLRLDLGIDACKVIQAKIARRAFKSDAALLPFVRDMALAASEAAFKAQQELWESIQELDAARDTNIDLSTLDRDTELGLVYSRPVLVRALEKSQDDLDKATTLSSASTQWIQLDRCNVPFIGPTVTSTTEKLNALTEIENWVLYSILVWLEDALTQASDEQCMSLASSAEEYRSAAQKAYSGDPEQMSVMLLTLGSYWLALDALAGSLLPLLHQYSPEIPANIYESLLLPKKDQMQRLELLELRLTDRHMKVPQGDPSLFADPVSKTSGFTFRYFDESPDHQKLRQKIITDAEKLRDDKKLEWRQKKDRYDTLQNQMQPLECSYKLDRDGYKRHDDRGCERCRIQGEMSSITIKAYEWPLPEDEVQSRLAVFYLRCPKVIAAWQDLTWLIVNDLGRTDENEKVDPKGYLHSYSGLQNYYESRSLRLILASPSKSLLVSHYRNMQFPVELHRVFCTHGLRYKLFDSSRRIWTSEQNQLPSFITHCEIQLPPGPYKNLQYTLNAAPHTQNMVLAGQTKCSPELSLHEFLAFGSLMSDGEHTRWLNICRELRAPNLTWNSEEVCKLIKQAIWLAGSPSTSFSRLTHSIVMGVDFAQELLSGLSNLLQSIEANRQSSHTMELIIVLSQRILSLNATNDCTSKALDLLQQCRSVVSLWADGLEESLRATTDAGQISIIQSSLLKVALLCKMTYNVETRLIPQMFTSSEELQFWTMSSILIHDNTPAADSKLNWELRRLLLANSKLSCSLHQRLKDLLSGPSGSGLDAAVLRRWATFKSHDEYWKSNSDRWVHKETSPGVRTKAQTISYDKLSGELLVDGRPLGLLPKTYTSHPSFVRLFGAQILRVSVSDMSAMMYMTTAGQHGYTIHFSLQETNHLLIRAQQESTVLELIPHEVFRNDLPTMFVEDYVHWLDLDASIVEFRPLSRRWVTEETNWRLTFQPAGGSYLQNLQSKLIDIHSPTFKSAFAVLGGLEIETFMHVIKRHQGKLHIELPRLGYQFSIDDHNDLECHELRKVVDRNQSIGTMIGLKSRLVLCERSSNCRKLDRVVLIPKGTVSILNEDNHVGIRIETKGRQIQCLRYHHDDILHRLEGDGSSLSRLYQAYLHALTSYVLPDPLTGYMGMEQAIKILEEQPLRCCKPLETSEIILLDLIKALTPNRTFYPPHLRQMQSITWHRNLSPLVQHDTFACLAQGILQHTQKFHIFYQDIPSGDLKSRGDENLRERASVRNATYLNPEYGGNVCIAKYDCSYQPRDMEPQSIRFDQIYTMSSLVLRWNADRAVSTQIAARWHQWVYIAGFGTTCDFTQSVSSLMNLRISTSWGSLYEYCRSATREKSIYKLLFLFAQITYGSQISNLDDLETLLAFATNPSLHDLPPFPVSGAFDLSKGSAPSKSKLQSAIQACVEPSPTPGPYFTPAEVRQQYSDYKATSSSNVEHAVDWFTKQWPCAYPKAIPPVHAKWLSPKRVQESVYPLFAEWHKNRECLIHLDLIQSVINRTMTSKYNITHDLTSWYGVEPSNQTQFGQSLPTLEDLMIKKLIRHNTSLEDDYLDPAIENPANNPVLRSLIDKFGDRFRIANTSTLSSYRNDLASSLDALYTHEELNLPDEIPFPAHALARANFEKCYQHHTREMDTLYHRLAPMEPTGNLLYLAGLWPRRGIRDLLCKVASTLQRTIGEQWKTTIISVGLSVCIVQRSRRLLLAVERDDPVSYWREMANKCRGNWDPEEQPDWLLLQIDNDLLIRPTQIRVASEMIEPTNLSNTLMQLNMGEGKSSVITPLIAASLADGNQLVRVVVLRSLSRQMQDTLIQRLCGLVNRPIYQMPFSRKNSIDENTIRRMQEMYEECKAKRGVMITQPEHILSFKLIGLERLASGNYTLGRKLMETQAWLDAHSRPVLDESDEILDVKFQLIYTLGTQRSLDGQSDRWLMIQSIFDIVQRHATLLYSRYPDQVEIEQATTATFPRIRLLSADVRSHLISKVHHDICESKVTGLVMSNLSARLKRAAASFIGNLDVTARECSDVVEYCSNDKSYLKKLLLARGLITGGILIHLLHGKRWLVNYGLHSWRCLFAVPYRAKGIPAPTAEFGHPDVAVGLTCLSYYYTGLSDHQLRNCLELLHKADDPSAEFETWTTLDDNFPQRLSHWNAVNLEDFQQCDEHLFPLLRFNKRTVDFFLKSVVFPKEGKEFDRKLSTSGWDIPTKKEFSKITTGFSGTNDNRFLLPSSITQRDLPELQHTSAKVLDILTRPENLNYFCAKGEDGAQLSTRHLLEFITRYDARVRVLIDVGAQILDFTNREVIAQWLQITGDVDAGVYFDEEDRPIVLTKSGKIEKLGTSSFVNRMDRCIVYLDDVHTRGTDLKLPRNIRAAVTLGPRLTKDRLVQACMRLRQLGQGQSLIYVAPPEVHQDILGIVVPDDAAQLNGLHVLEWALVQSNLQIDRNQPLRVVQGLSYHSRQAAVQGLKQQLLTIGEPETSITKYIEENVVEHEAQSLEDLYAPDPMRAEVEPALLKSSRSTIDEDVQELIALWDEMNPQATKGANVHEELEREVGHEVEQERQIHRPPTATALVPQLDPKLKTYIKTSSSSTLGSFLTAHYGVLRDSSMSHLLAERTRVWQHVRLSKDFIETITGNYSNQSDDYIRPVHWVLVSKDTSIRSVLVISQHEVNQTLKSILDPSSRVTLVVYEPRVTRSLPSIDSEPFDCLPGAKEAWAHLPDQTKQELHLFAGQLYFTDFEEYERFVKTVASSCSASNKTAAASPSPSFIRSWMGIRRKGQSFEQTHVGQVVSERILHRETFVGFDAMDVDSKD